jgi:hypothetical protein
VKCAEVVSEDNIVAEINKYVPIVQFVSRDGWRQLNVVGCRVPHMSHVISCKCACRLNTAVSVCNLDLIKSLTFHPTLP